ncbi:hypothetical protein J2S43_002517 [Catenuloplanes nepalensis]|uniref:Uncharacterized protein n=1 Tax=Catenuloplanes nepalensis TaxID=587533 RepID=A0ABT9MRF5_9ACTN|nr:hypothetical protein [Catenuloplanes nepalensis]MDP9794005.1 hypothetical protein [Catenuloplanes nepalensis]
MTVRYLRARRVPAALLGSSGAIVLVVAVWWLFAEDGPVFPVLAVLAVALGLAPLVPTLAGNDAALEATAALPWPPRRLAHLVACGAVVAGLLYAARLGGADFGPAGQIVRNVAGLVGVAGLAAGLLGTGFAWPAPVALAAVQALGAPGEQVWRQVAYWMMQPAGNRPAAVTAAVLLLAGLAAYAIRGGPTPVASEAPAAR